MEEHGSPEPRVPYGGAGLIRAWGPLWRGRAHPGLGSSMEEQGSPKPGVLRTSRSGRELLVPADPQGLAGALGVGGVPSWVPGPAGLPVRSWAAPGQLPSEAFKSVLPEKQTRGRSKSIPTKVQSQESVGSFIFSCGCL